MKEVFKRQQKRGGIIDIEAEKKKFLIQSKVGLSANQSNEDGTVKSGNRLLQDDK